MSTAAVLQESQTIGRVLTWAEDYFKKKSLADPALEARVLLSGLLNFPSTHILLRKEDLFPLHLISLYQEMVRRRASREPAAYILGRQNFFGKWFYVDNRVLIPRPETELVVERVAEFIRQKEWRRPRLLDVGTGSGCIAVTLATLFKEARVIALDAFEPALDVARKNAYLHDAQNVHFLRSNLFESLGPDAFGYFDIIVSNPPYVSSTEWEMLEPELSLEPRAALDGGKDGFDFFSIIINQAPRFLSRGGALVLEIGYAHADRVHKEMMTAGFTNIEVNRDYGGHDRIIFGEFFGSI